MVTTRRWPGLSNSPLYIFVRVYIIVRLNNLILKEVTMLQMDFVQLYIVHTVCALKVEQVQLWSDNKLWIPLMKII